MGARLSWRIAPRAAGWCPVERNQRAMRDRRLSPAARCARSVTTTPSGCVSSKATCAADPGARLACVSVLKTSRIAIDNTTDAEGRHLHVKRLVELQHWARPLDLPGERMTYHVLAAPDIADAIVDYVKTNGVDHVVIGSRGLPTLQRVLGSVSAKVVAMAPCTVTVVKTPQVESEASGGAAGDGARSADDPAPTGAVQDTGT